jgi:hypothetical protein
MCFQEKCKLAGSTTKEARHVEGLKLRVFINIGIQKKNRKNGGINKLYEYNLVHLNSSI